MRRPSAWTLLHDAVDFPQPSFLLSIIVLSSSFETEQGTVYENHPRTAAADAVYDYDPPRKEAQAVCRERSRRFQAQKGKLARKTLENGPFRPVDLPVFWNMAGAATHEDSPKRSITPYHQAKGLQRDSSAHDECPELDREGEGAASPAEASDVTDGGSFTWEFLCSLCFFLSMSNVNVLSNLGGIIFAEVIAKDLKRQFSEPRVNPSMKGGGFANGGKGFDCTFKAQEPKSLSVSCFRISDDGRAIVVDTSNARNDPLLAVGNVGVLKGTDGKSLAPSNPYAYDQARKRRSRVRREAREGSLPNLLNHLRKSEVEQLRGVVPLPRKNMSRIGELDAWPAWDRSLRCAIVHGKNARVPPLLRYTVLVYRLDGQAKIEHDLWNGEMTIADAKLNAAALSKYLRSANLTE
ncbi:vacuolar protein, partial [Perkinsus olseni]